MHELDVIILSTPTIALQNLPPGRERTCEMQMTDCDMITVRYCVHVEVITNCTRTVDVQMKRKTVWGC